MIYHFRLQHHVTSNKNGITPSRNAGAVTSRYANSMGITFLFSHQRGRIFSRYVMVADWHANLYEHEWSSWWRRFFLLVALLADKHNVFFTILYSYYINRPYIITIWLKFRFANTFCLK